MALFTEMVRQIKDTTDDIIPPKSYPFQTKLTEICAFLQIFRDRNGYLTYGQYELLPYNICTCNTIPMIAKTMMQRNTENCELIAFLCAAVTDHNGNLINTWLA